jgi:hypothetical protein
MTTVMKASSIINTGYKIDYFEVDAGNSYGSDFTEATVSYDSADVITSITGPYGEAYDVVNVFTNGWEPSEPY